MGQGADCPPTSMRDRRGTSPPPPQSKEVDIDNDATLVPFFLAFLILPSFWIIGFLFST